MAEEQNNEKESFDTLNLKETLFELLINSFTTLDNNSSSFPSNNEKFDG